jgi:hypothetical protein
VSENLDVKLTGWAVPVYRAVLADDLMAELNAL